jgi:hypothetical protein
VKNAQILSFTDSIMDNANNTQNYRKTILTLIAMTIGGVVIFSSSTANIDAATKDPRYDTSGDCETYFDEKNKESMKTCCWREKVPGQILGQTYCQTCQSNGTNCGDKELQMDLVKVPESSRPSNDDQLAEDQQVNQPSIRSDESIDLDDGKLKQDSQQDTSNTVENSNSGTITSFAKKGNGQTSPVPPECPKQGPIPPNCTMKPKF